MQIGGVELKDGMSRSLNNVSKLCLYLWVQGTQFFTHGLRKVHGWRATQNDSVRLVAPSFPCGAPDPEDLALGQGRGKEGSNACPLGGLSQPIRLPLVCLSRPKGEDASVARGFDSNPAVANRSDSLSNGVHPRRALLFGWSLHS